MNQCIVRYKPQFLALMALFPLASISVDFWAYYDAKDPSTIVAILSWALAGLTAILAARAASFRLIADDSGLVVRKMGRSTVYAWGELQGARLSVRVKKVGIVESYETRDPRAATHLTLITGREPIHLNTWMSGIAELVAQLAARGVIDRQPSPEAPGAVETAATKALSSAARSANVARLMFLAGFALLSFSFIAAAELSKKMTGNCGLDALLIAVGVGVLIGGGAALAHYLRNRALQGVERPSQLDFKDVLLDVALVSMAGLLFIWFAPHLFESTNDPWVNWGLVGLGVVFIVAAARDVVRYSRGQ